MSILRGKGEIFEIDFDTDDYEKMDMEIFNIMRRIMVKYVSNKILHGENASKARIHVIHIASQAFCEINNEVKAEISVIKNNNNHLS